MEPASVLSPSSPPAPSRPRPRAGLSGLYLLGALLWLASLGLLTFALGFDLQSWDLEDWLLLVLLIAVAGSWAAVGRGLGPRSRRQLGLAAMACLSLGLSLGVWRGLDRDRERRIQQLAETVGQRLSDALAQRLRVFEALLRLVSGRGSELALGDDRQVLEQYLTALGADARLLLWSPEPAAELLDAIPPAPSPAADPRGAWPALGESELSWRGDGELQLRCVGPDRRRRACVWQAGAWPGSLAARLSKDFAVELRATQPPASAAAGVFAVPGTGDRVWVSLSHPEIPDPGYQGILPLWSLGLGLGASVLLLVITRSWFRTAADRAALGAANRDLQLEVEDLEAAEQRLRAVFDTAPFGMLVADAAGEMLRVNARLESMFGHPAGSLRGRPVEELVPAALVVRHVGLRESYQARPERRRMGSGRNLSGRDAGGAEFPVEVALSPYQEASEHPLVLAAVRDLRPRRELERQRRERARQLEAGNESLDQFVYVASHDLRSPLDGIRKLRDWILSDNQDQLDAEACAWLEAMGVDVEELAARMEALLVYSRAGRVHGKLGGVDVAELLADLQGELLDPQGMVLELLNPMPTFRTYGAPLRDVFRCLLTCLIDLHRGEPRAGGAIRVAVFTQPRDYEFRVESRELPRPAAAAVQSLEKFGFSQAGLSEAGMSLPLARRLVEQYGGEVGVELGQERGLQFRFSWPREIRERALSARRRAAGGAPP